MFNIFKDTIGRDLMKIANHFNGRVDSGEVFKDRKALAINRIKNAVLDGEIGGGGVTPEIMAQIENAQWKTEAEVTLFNESVTTSPGSGGVNLVRLEYGHFIDSDVLKVNINGVEYTCPKVSLTETANGYGGIGPTGPDFTEFPFAITSEENNGEIINTIITETAGEYYVSAKSEGVTTTEEFNAIAGTFTANGYTSITDILNAIRNFRHVIFIKTLSDSSYRVYSLTRYKKIESTIEGGTGQFAEFTSISYDTNKVTLYTVVITKSGATESQVNLSFETT